MLEDEQSPILMVGKINHLRKHGPHMVSEIGLGPPNNGSRPRGSNNLEIPSLPLSQCLAQRARLLACWGDAGVTLYTSHHLAVCRKGIERFFCLFDIPYSQQGSSLEPDNLGLYTWGQKGRCCRSRLKHGHQIIGRRSQTVACFDFPIPPNLQQGTTGCRRSERPPV